MTENSAPTDKQLFIKVREQLLLTLGDHCQRCGYHEYSSALMLYHPWGKKWGESLVSRLLRKFILAPSVQNWAGVLNAASNCSLLCNNCYQALDAGEWELSAVKYQ